MKSLPKFDPSRDTTEQIEEWMDNGANGFDCCRALVAADDHGILPRPGNAVQVLEIYKAGPFWVFDDERFDLEREPFVQGASEAIDKLAAHAGLSHRDRLFLVFSRTPMPNSHRFTRDNNGLLPEKMGATYTTDDGHRLWLCSAMAHYTGKGLAPAELHAFVR
jgi:hypothetical protein